MARQNLRDYQFASNDSRNRAMEWLGSKLHSVFQKSVFSDMELDAVFVFNALLKRWRNNGPFDIKEDGARARDSLDFLVTESSDMVQDPPMEG